MKLISQFEKNGSTFAEDEDGNIYELRLVKKANQIDTDAKLKRQIVDMLQELQVPTSYSSYKFLIDCLYYSIKYEPGNLDALACRWGRTPEYKKIFGSKTVAAKKMILGLTDYFFKYQEN